MYYRWAKAFSESDRNFLIKNVIRDVTGQEVKNLDLKKWVRITEFTNVGRRVTHRLARYIHELCKMLTISDVAGHLDLDPKTVKEIDKAFLEQSFGQTDYNDMRILLIDEIAVRKGHNYMTVVADYFTGRVIWMGKDRNKRTLDEFFDGMSEQQKEAVEAVTMDMWEPDIDKSLPYQVRPAAVPESLPRNSVNYFSHNSIFSFGSLFMSYEIFYTFLKGYHKFHVIHSVSRRWGSSFLSSRGRAEPFLNPVI